MGLEFNSNAEYTYNFYKVYLIPSLISKGEIAKANYFTIVANGGRATFPTKESIAALKAKTSNFNLYANL